MEIIDLKVLRGPNCWSATHKQLIDMVVRIPESNADIDNNNNSLPERLGAVFPAFSDTLNNLMLKVQPGFPLHEITGHIAKELQVKADMQAEFITAEKSSATDVYHIVFLYTVKQAGVYAGTTAVKIIKLLLAGESYSELQTDIDELLYIKSRSIGPTTGYLLNEIIKRNIPFKRFNESSLVVLGHGVRQKKMRTAVTDSTSGLGMELASDKEETKQLLANVHIPVPKGILIDSEEELEERINEVQFPIVVKPLNGNHGRGVTTDVNTLEDARFGYHLASRISSTVIVEEYIKGDDYRFLVVDYKLVAATKRSPASVTGDGVLTIKELIDNENQNPQRGYGSQYVLAPIKIDDVTNKILAAKKLTPESVLPAGELLVLKETANISAGGIATDVTDSVHPDNVFLAERVARMFNLNICGIDIMATAVDVPLTRDIGAIIEVNAGPGLRMHSNPQKGTPRNVAAKITDMLFPDLNAALIPLIAVADYPEAATLVKLIAHIATHAGLKPGYNTSEGIYIQNHLSTEGNCTHFEDVQEVLFDPTVDIAVSQCTDECIQETGLAFDHCTISIIADIKERADKQERPGVSGEMLKKVIMKSTLPEGYCILNADNDSVYAMLPEAQSVCGVALFSTDKSSERIKQHCKNGGMAVVLDKTTVIVCEGEKCIPLVEMKSIDAAVASYILPAVLTAVLRNIRFDVIQNGLASFMADPSQEVNAELLSIIASENYV
jgi:cyanophycin synthetase